MLQAGYFPETDRDELTIAFAEHGENWRESYWRETFYDVLEQKHEWQKWIEAAAAEQGSGGIEILDDLLSVLPRAEGMISQYLIDNEYEREDTVGQI